MRDTNQTLSTRDQRLALPTQTPQRSAVQGAVQRIRATVQPLHAVHPALLEFNSFGRLCFATREAQKLLGFALEPLWGCTVSEVLARVQQVSVIERLVGGPVERVANAQSTATETALGALNFWLELQLDSQPSEWITCWFRSAPTDKPACATKSDC